MTLSIESYYQSTEQNNGKDQLLKWHLPCMHETQCFLKEMFKCAGVPHLHDIDPRFTQYLPRSKVNLKVIL